MDGVIADFDKSILLYCKDLNTSEKYQDVKNRDAKIDHICETIPDFFQNLLPYDGAIEAVHRLFEFYEVYFLSTPMWDVPHSFTGKRIWIEKHFGKLGKKKLILTHRKDLNIGDYLVDDRIRNRAGEFKGMHIQFGTDEFPDWEMTLKYLQNNAEDSNQTSQSCKKGTSGKFLFLDDIRHPHDVYRYTQQIMFLQKKWEIVKNYNDFIEWFAKNGLPDFISFDHDLADMENTSPPPSVNNDQSKEWQDAQIHNEKTGYECAKWLVDYCLDNNLGCPKFYCHSMNPVGKDKINGLLNQFSTYR